MKICHMTSAHDSYDTRIFYKECSYIAHDDSFEVSLIAPGKSRFEDKVTIIGIGEKPESRIKRMFCFTQKVYRKAIEINADLYHFHDPELLPIGLKLKRKGKAVIFDSHEDNYSSIKIKKYIPSLMRDLIAFLYQKYERYVCKRIDGVVFVCTVNGTNPFLGIAKRVILVDNVPIISQFTPSQGIEKEYDICCAGSLTEERGITVLLEAAKKAGAKVVIAGQFSPKEYRTELEEKGLLEDVIFKGFCELSDVKKMLSASKMVVSNIKWVGQYNHSDNLPTKVYEAMAMGLPVIISNFPFCERLNKEYDFAICVNPEDVNELVESINLILSDDKLCSRLGENGRKLIENRYSWEKECKKIINLYKEILNTEEGHE